MSDNIKNIISSLDTTLEKSVAQTLYLNEIAGYDPYKLSHAGEDLSGFSFGYNQLDLASGNADAIPIFKNILDGYYGQEEGNSFYSSIENKLLIQSNPNALSSEEQSKINVALSSAYGKSVLDASFVDEVRSSIAVVNDLEERIGGSIDNEAKILLADYHNQFTIENGGPIEQNLKNLLTSQDNEINFDEAREARLNSAKKYESRMDRAQEVYQQYREDFKIETFLAAHKNSSPEEIIAAVEAELLDGESEESISKILKNSSLHDVLQSAFDDMASGGETIDQSISTSYTTFSSSVINAILRVDPLIIDLNGDGLKLSSWESSGVTFDLNGDGFSESTGWTTASSDDAFLVLDKNSNGNVDSIDELFGNSSSTGFEVLKKFDSNADNLINSTDAQFNLLKLWKDLNANGVVNEGELTSLLESGITEISLKTLNNLYSSSGNLVTETAEVKITDSQTNIVSTRTVSEVLFAMNQFNSSIVNPDEALGPNFTLDINTLLLPYSRGYGSLNSWQVAMTLNSELLETAQTLANLSPTNFYQINSLFETFLFQWAGVEDFIASQVYESGTSTKIDHRKVAFLEKATGLDFRVPNDAVIAQAQTSWDLFYNTLLARFLTQGTFKEIFPEASYGFSTDTTSINTTLDQAITNILSLSSSLDKNSFLNYAYYSKTILQLNKDQFTSETSTTFDTKVNTMLTSIINSVAIPNFSFNGIFNIGTDAAETLYGAVNSDILKGESGDDFIYAESGNDYIEGNEGSDYLKGGAGDDIYKFNLGDGQDTIEETSGTDKIVFGSSITQTSLAFARIGVDLLISIGSGSDANSSDKIGIKNFYSATTNRVETIEFYDGAQLSLGSIIYGTEGNDLFFGTDLDDVLNGSQGNDTFYPNNGNDTIVGGTGNDYSESHDAGNETYIFNIGDGQDVIYDYRGADKIVFGDGITKDDITLISYYISDGDNGLTIKIGTNGDQIYLRQFFENDDNTRKIETLQFADGTSLSLVIDLHLTGSVTSGEIIKGTDGNDTITGNIGNDTIYGSYGNDTLIGGKGNDYFEKPHWISTDDTYLFNIGDGQDVIYDANGTDKIIFGAGITQSDITLISDYGTNKSVIIKIGTNGDQIRINSFFNYTNNYEKIETLQFADGSAIN